MDILKLHLLPDLTAQVLLQELVICVGLDLVESSDAAWLIDQLHTGWLNHDCVLSGKALLRVVYLH